jgi:hypothetical protein
MPTYTIEWDGVDYDVPEKQFFDVVSEIEAHVTLPELLRMVGTGEINYSKLALPLHALLRHVGAPNVPELREIRRELIAESFERIKAIQNGETPEDGRAMQVVTVIMGILMDDAPENVKAEAPGKKKPRSSKAATKSRSANGASRRATSGK